MARNCRSFLIERAAPDGAHSPLPGNAERSHQPNPVAGFLTLRVFPHVCPAASPTLSRPETAARLRPGVCILPFCPQKLHLRRVRSDRCRLRPDQPPRAMRCASDFGAGTLLSASSPRARPCSTGCARKWERRERRKVAPKAIAARARWSWRGSRADRLVYEPFNACILLLGQLDGAELITIEDLASGGELHPLQQAMVDTHASQCGFCTPGIVMSLFAAYHSGEPMTYAGLCDQLAGNLCRCTGYRPIIAAALESVGRRACRPFRRDVSRARRGARRPRRP